MSDVVDKAKYSDDAVASSGQISFNSPKLRWNGSIPVGGEIVMTYSVVVSDDATGEIVNKVYVDNDGSAASAACVDGKDKCVVSTAVLTEPGDRPLASTGVDMMLFVVGFLGLLLLCVGGGMLLLFGLRRRKENQ